MSCGKAPPQRRGDGNVYPGGWEIRPDMGDGFVGEPEKAATVIVYAETVTRNALRCWNRFLRDNPDVRAEPVEFRACVITSTIPEPDDKGGVRYGPDGKPCFLPRYGPDGKPLTEERPTAWQVSADALVIRALTGDTTYQGNSRIPIPDGVVATVPDAVRELVTGWHPVLNVSLPRGGSGSGPVTDRTARAERYYRKPVAVREAIDETKRRERLGTQERARLELCESHARKQITPNGKP